MVQLKHKQAKTLSKFFYIGVEKHYFSYSDIENMQLDMSDAIGVTVQSEDDETAIENDDLLLPGDIGWKEAAEAERARCGVELADTMIGALRQADDGNAELAMCVMDWAFGAFAMWHAGQCEYWMDKMARWRMQLIYPITAPRNAARMVFRTGFTIPVYLSEFQGTVSAALDRFMAAYSTGKFPLDLTRDKVQVDKQEFEQLPDKIRACLKKRTQSPEAWQRAFTDMVNKRIDEHRKGQQDYE